MMLALLLIYQLRTFYSKTGSSHGKVWWYRVNWHDLCKVILFWSEVSYGEALGGKNTMYIRVTLHWGYLIVLWLFHLVCILYFCNELITRPEKSYGLWCVVVCDLETSKIRRPRPALGRSATTGGDLVLWLFELVVCVCVGNMCICICCDLYCLYCVFVLFCLRTFILISFVCTRSKKRAKITFFGNVTGSLHLHGKVLVHHSAYSPPSKTLESETCHWIHRLRTRKNMALSETWAVIQFPFHNHQCTALLWNTTSPSSCLVINVKTGAQGRHVDPQYPTIQDVCHQACSNEWVLDHLPHTPWLPEDWPPQGKYRRVRHISSQERSLGKWSTGWSISMPQHPTAPI
jgi:hypothetical protein